ncbi:MAG: hypothetical protein K0R34_2141 [Herbinix sp.]|jgi:hypothetical protein|nr:hypothetical protein [Herbinix sp.]
MKKMFTRIAALMFLVMLVSAPSTALAASTPVLVINVPGTKVFEYQPPYYLESGHSTILQDTTTSDGRWYVPAGNTFSIDCMLINGQTGTFRMVISSDTGIVYNESVTANWLTHEILPQSTAKTYQVLIYSYSGISIDTYTGSYWQ